MRTCLRLFSGIGPISIGACHTGNESYQAAVVGPSTQSMTFSTKGCSVGNPSFQAAYGHSSTSNVSSNGYSSYGSQSGGTHGFCDPRSYSAHTDGKGKISSTIESPTLVGLKSKFHKAFKSKKLQSPVTHTPLLDHPNQKFMQLLPVHTQFPDSKSLPKSMADISASDQIVNFYPVYQKGSNYLKYCLGWLSDQEKPIDVAQCVKRYTSGSNWYCTEVNMALASDSPRLFSYGPYIRQLKYSIGMSRMRFNGTVFRGEPSKNR